MHIDTDNGCNRNIDFNIPNHLPLELLSNLLKPVKQANEHYLLWRKVTLNNRVSSQRTNLPEKRSSNKSSTVKAKPMSLRRMTTLKILVMKVSPFQISIPVSVSLLVLTHYGVCVFAIPEHYHTQMNRSLKKKQSGVLTR